MRHRVWLKALLADHRFFAGGGFGGGGGLTLDGGGLAFDCSLRPLPGGCGGGGFEPFLLGLGLVIQHLPFFNKFYPSDIFGAY